MEAMMPTCLQHIQGFWTIRNPPLSCQTHYWRLCPKSLICLLLFWWLDFLCFFTGVCANLTERGRCGVISPTPTRYSTSFGCFHFPRNLCPAPPHPPPTYPLCVLLWYPSGTPQTHTEPDRLDCWRFKSIALLCFIDAPPDDSSWHLLMLWVSSKSLTSS